METPQVGPLPILLLTFCYSIKDATEVVRIQASLLSGEPVSPNGNLMVSAKAHVKNNSTYSKKRFGAVCSELT